jgi:hypothetical protein
MSIIRATIIKTFFSVGAIIAPFIIEEQAWRAAQPACLTEGGWVSDKDYTWQKGNSLDIAPGGNPYLKIAGTPIQDCFEIHNKSGDGQYYVLQRLHSFE